jgi:hypothetical protein
LIVAQYGAAQENQDASLSVLSVDVCVADSDASRVSLAGVLIVQAVNTVVLA